MQLRHLRYFITVAEEGSFIRASARLHVAQPAISKQIHDLEREVGCTLFERLPRGVRLTAAGSAFLLEARSTLENATRAVASARDAHGRLEKRLAVAVPPATYLPSQITELFTRFRETRPDCELLIRTMSDPKQKTALRGRALCAAIGWKLDAVAPEFGSLELLDCSLDGVLLPKSHSLAQQSYVSLACLQPLTRLHNPRRASGDLFNSLRKALLDRGLDPAHHRAVSSDISTLSMNIAAGNAYSLANSHTAKAYVDGNDRIVFRRFTEAPIPAALMLFWRAGNIGELLQDLIRVGEEIKAGISRGAPAAHREASVEPLRAARAERKAFQ